MCLSDEAAVVIVFFFFSCNTKKNLPGENMEVKKDNASNKD